MTRWLMQLVILLFLSATPAVAGEPPDLAGHWLLTMPRGFEYDAILEPGVEAGLYRLRCGAVNLQGVYELRGRRLTMIQPVNSRLAGLVWEIKNKNVLLLIEHPEPSRVGSDYRNASLTAPVRVQRRAAQQETGAPATGRVPPRHAP